MSAGGQTKSQTLKYALYTQNLPADMTDLYELSRSAGVTFDPQVFKIIVELLRLNVAPTGIERMLKSLALQHQRGAELTDEPATRGAPSVVPKRKGSLR